MGIFTKDEIIAVIDNEQRLLDSGATLVSITKLGLFQAEITANEIGATREDLEAGKNVFELCKDLDDDHFQDISNDVDHLIFIFNQVTDKGNSHDHSS